MKVIVDGTIKHFTIFDINNLDPITVVIQDFGIGKGRIILECYGSAWSGYWGAMGDSDTLGFIKSCDEGYIVNKLRNQDMKKSNEKYLAQVVKALKEYLNLAEQL